MISALDVLLLFSLAWLWVYVIELRQEMRRVQKELWGPPSDDKSAIRTVVPSVDDEVNKVVVESWNRENET